MSWQKFYARCMHEEQARWHKGPSLKDRAWYIGPCMVTTIFGRAGEDPYKTDIQFGSLALHVFWRGDVDPDPHDHQFDFWTLPFVSYDEDVLVEGELRRNVVKRFRVHHRKAEYTHRLTARADHLPMVLPGKKRPVVTLVWRGKKRRMWGFWVRKPDMLDMPYWEKVPWREYIGRPT